MLDGSLRCCFAGMAGNRVCSDATIALEDRELSYHLLIWDDRELVVEMDSGLLGPIPNELQCRFTRTEQI